MRPYFVELAGLPAGGKTTTARALSDWLTTRHLTAIIIPEPGPTSKLQDAKLDWKFNAWTLCQTVSSILEHEHLKTVDFVILDRGLLDAQCWIRWFESTRALDSDTAGRISGFAQIDGWFSRQACTVVLRDEYETAMYRRRQQAPSRIVNARTFAKLWRAYEEVVAGFTANRPDYAVEIVATDSYSPDEVLDRVLRVIARSVPELALDVPTARIAAAV